MNTASFAGLITGNIIYRCLNILINLLITLLLTRLLTTQGYGTLSLLIANASIFNLATCLGSDSAITYHYSKRDLSPARLFSILYFIIIFQLLALAIAETICFLTTGHFWLLNATSFSILLWSIGFFLCLIIIDKYIALLNGAHQFTLANKAVFLANLLGLLILSWAYLYRPAEPTLFYLQLFILSTALQALALILSFHLVAGNAPQFIAVGKTDWKLFFSYSFIAFFSNLVQFFAYRVDYWIVDYYHGKDQLGLYSLAVKLGQMLWILPLLFASIILPVAADKEKIEQEKKIFPLIRICNSFLTVISLFAALIAGWFIPFFAGNTYELSVGPFVCLLPGLLLFAVNINLAAYFAGKGRLRVNLVGGIICLVVVLVLDFILIPSNGIIGAAIASSIAYSVSSLYLITQFVVMTRLPFSTIAWMKKQDLMNVMQYLKKIIRS